MARVKEAAAIYEVGNEPEYFISNLLKFDTMPGGMVRLYFGAMRGDHARVEYTVVSSTTNLVLMAKEAINIASTVHNELTLANGKPN